MIVLARSVISKACVLTAMLVVFALVFGVGVYAVIKTAVFSDFSKPI